MTAKLFLSTVLCAVTFAGCQPEKLEQGKEIAAEVENRKIKRITPEMIGQETHRIGDSLVLIAYKALRPDQDAGPKSCNLADYAAINNLTDLYRAKAGYALSKDRQKYQRFMANRQEWQMGLPALDPEGSEAEVYALGDSLYYIMPIAPEIAGLLTCFRPADTTTTNGGAGYWYAAFHKQGIAGSITRKVKKSRRGRK